MSKRNINYVVKVLSGVNQGATAELHDDSGVVIGRSAACDIIFSGENVADRHVAVELDGSRIRLTPLAQPVYIDGKDVGSHEVVLRPNQLVNIGVVDFTIADKNQPWPDYDATTRKLIAANESGDFADSNKDSAKSLLGKPWLWVALATMFLANVHYLAKDYGGIPGLLGMKQTAGQKLVDMLDVEKFPGLYVKHMSNGMTQVTGYVATQAEKKLVEKQVSSYARSGGNINTHIFVDSELEDNARRIAYSLGEDEVSFTTLEHGRLKASGLINSRSTWLSVKESIRSDVRGVISVNDDAVKNLGEMFSVLQQAVTRKSFGNRLNLKLRKGTIVVKGKLTKLEKTHWQQIKEDFINHSDYPFRFREIIRSPDADIKLSIRSVSVGEIPFVVSKEGNKYFIGSHVGSGYYIKSINDDHVLLKNNNIEFPVYFGQERKNIK